MSLIDISELGFSFDGEHALFDRVSLQLDTDWKLGLIGRNGRGKTTFLRILNKELAHAGSIHSQVSFGYFPFPVPDRDWTSRQLADRFCPESGQWRLERETSLLELPLEALDRPFSTLSGGEATKLLLALLFLQDGTFPLIDEPTNHLDLRARQAVGDYLRRKRGFILVSHDRHLLDSCIDHVLSINKAGIELRKGTFSSWNENRQRADQCEQAQRDTLRKEIVRLTKSARNSALWSDRAERGKYGNGPVDRGYIGHKAAKMMKRAKATQSRREKAVDEIAGLLKNVEAGQAVSIRYRPFHAKRLAQAGGLSLEYDGKTVAQGISFLLTSGERLIVNGSNGSGKSSLLKLLAGQPVRFRGDLAMPGGLVVSYVPQHTSSLRGTVRDIASARGISESLYRAVLDRLGFERRQFAMDASEFSVGQRKKALLAASLCQEANLYIWDEPLNSIDLMSRMQIENLILEHAPSMVLVEHDRVFTQRVGTLFVELDGLQAG